MKPRRNLRRFDSPSGKQIEPSRAFSSRGFANSIAVRAIDQ